MSTSTTSLHHAAHNGDIEEVKRLLRSDFLFVNELLVNEIDRKYGATPLYLAAKQGHHHTRSFNKNLDKDREGPSKPNI